MPTRGEEGAAGTGPAKAVVLLSGNPDLDRPTREAVVQLGLPVASFQEPEEALAEAARPETVLLVVDAANRSLGPGAFLSSVAAARGDSPPPCILLTGGGDSPSPEAGGTQEGPDHILSRPFRAATLATLCRAVLAESAAGGTAARRNEAPSPPLQVRRPARFSARPLYAEATRFVRDALEGAREGRRPDLVPLGVLAERIHTSLLQSNLLLLRALEPYARFELANHCVNVATLAGKVAMGMGLPLAETQQAIQAGLLHDIGMARVPERVLQKEGPLTPLEREEVERHPIHGAEILGDLGEEWEWLRRAIRQEHERLNGQGYPEGLSGDAIDPIARIIGVADVFEAFSQVRSYRSPFTLYEALEKVMGMREEYFPGEIVDVLASEISVFPVDSYVQLSSGQIGRVVGVDPSNLMRPAVELLWDADWTPLPRPRRMQLAMHPDISIARPLHEAEVPIT